VKRCNCDSVNACFHRVLEGGETDAGVDEKVGMVTGVVN